MDRENHARAYWHIARAQRREWDNYFDGNRQMPMLVVWDGNRMLETTDFNRIPLNHPAPHRREIDRFMQGEPMSMDMMNRWSDRAPIRDPSLQSNDFGCFMAGGPMSMEMRDMWSDGFARPGNEFRFSAGAPAFRFPPSMNPNAAEFRLRPLMNPNAPVFRF